MHFLLARQPTKEGADIGGLAVKCCGKPTLMAAHTSALDFCALTPVNAQARKINRLT